MQKKNQSGKSLKFKLISLSLFTTFLFGLVCAGVLKYIVNTQEKAQLNSFEAYGQNLSDAIAAQFFERYGDIQAFSISPAMQSSNKSSIVEMLNTFSAMYGIYDLIMLVDTNGKLIAVNHKAPDGKDISVDSLYKDSFSEAPWFKAVMAGQFTENKEKNFGGTYVEDVQIDPWTTQVYGSNRLGNSFSAAVKDASGKVIGVISNRAGSRWFEVAFRELYAGLKKSGFPHSELTLLDKNGRIIFEYTSDPSSEKLSDSVYDWSTLLKSNLAGGKLQSVKDVIAGRSGALLEVNPKSQILQIVGFVPVSGQKFIDTIGWSVLVRDEQKEAMASLNQAQQIFYSVFVAVTVLACLISYFFAIGLSKKLSSLASRLSLGSSEVLSASTTISTSSSELAGAATEQAATIQETAASIDEVSSMVKKSADNAGRSKSASQMSRNAAQQGQEAVQKMSASINEISHSNTAIMTQVAESNRKISEIVGVISEIGNKTKVINDIVFQTKLLSFNASVEAARAGEHGKGFAVVAEEVGNLAQMSGNAAKEISSMLEASIRKVEGIVTDTKTKVEQLVTESRSKVDVGIQVSKTCGDVLTNILSTVQEVDQMVGEISLASHEQAQGISEINKAVNQMDQVTQQNSAIAQSAASAATQLSTQSEQLSYVVRDLVFMINGTMVDQSEQQKENKAPTIGKVVSINRKHSERPSRPSEAKLKMAAVGTGPLSVPEKTDPRFEDV